MAQLNPAPCSTISLYRIPAKGQLVGEASSLGLRPGHQWDRLYDDACDVGIVLRSHKTGELSRWYLSEENQEAWIFKPCPETIRAQPQLAAYTLHILND